VIRGEAAGRKHEPARSREGRLKAKWIL
jgi:hypothetical protein